MTFDEVQTELSSAEDRGAKISEFFDAGYPLPRDEAVHALGTERAIAWWDMFDVPEIASPPIEAGAMVRSNAEAVPAAQWGTHRMDYAAPGGHGLTLENAPEVVALFRRPDGKCGAVIGYRLRA